MFVLKLLFDVGLHCKLLELERGKPPPGGPVCGHSAESGATATTSLIVPNHRLAD